MGTFPYVVVTHTTKHTARTYFAALEAARAYAAHRQKLGDVDRFEIVHDHEMIDVGEVIAETTR